MNKQKKSNFRLIVKRFNQLWKSTVNPLGSFYYYFLLLVTVNALYNIVGCSILVFEECLQFYSLWLISNAISDLINLLDVFVQSRVMYLKHGIWVTKREKTLRRYIKKKTFYLDVVAIIPVDLLLFVWPELSLLRLNRLAKLHRAADFTNRIEVRTELPHMFRLLRLVVICFSIFHLNCCAYHEFSYVYNNLDATVNDWVYSPAKIPNLRYANCDARYNVGSCTMNESNRNFWKRDLYIDDLRSYWENRFNETDFGQFTRKYTLSFYWSALTLTTLGEQPWPNNSPEMIFETLDTIVGLLLFAIILGQIGSMVSHMNAARTQFEEVHDGCKRYMNYRRVESSVQSRVFRFLGFSGVKGQTMLSEQEVASSLPPRLHSELMADVHLQTLKDVEMFADCEVSLLTELAQKLQLQTFCPGDVICRNEDAGKALFIVKCGRLNVMDERERVSDVLTNGRMFGEVAVLNSSVGRQLMKQQSIVRSIGYSELYVLTREDLWLSLVDYPNCAQEMMKKARSLQHRNHEDDGKSNELFNVEIKLPTTYEEKLNSMLKVVNAFTEELEQFEHRCHEDTAHWKQRLTNVEFAFERMDYKRRMKSVRRKVTSTATPMATNFTDECNGSCDSKDESTTFILTTLDDLASSQRMLSFFFNGYLTLFCVGSGILLNGLCIFIFLRFRQGATSIIQYYLITLTAWQSALLFSAFFLYCLPTLIFGRVVNFGFYAQFYPISYVFANASHTGCVWIAVVLTVDRYLALCRPLKHPAIGKKCRVRRLMIAVSGFALFFSLPRYFEVTLVDHCTTFELSNELEIIRNSSNCQHQIERTVLTQNVVYWTVYHILLQCLFITVVPCFILCALTCQISFALRSAGQRRKSLCQVTSGEYSLGSPRGSAESGKLKNNDHRSNVMLVLIIAKFLIANLLPTVADVLEHIVGDEAFRTSPLATLFVDFSNLLLVLNCSTNFYVFLLWSKRFRRSCCALLFTNGCGGAFVAKLLFIDSDLVSLTAPLPSQRARRQSSSAVPLLNSTRGLQSPFSNRVQRKSSGQDRRISEDQFMTCSLGKPTRASSCTATINSQRRT